MFLIFYNWVEEKIKYAGGGAGVGSRVWQNKFMRITQKSCAEAGTRGLISCRKSAAMDEIFLDGDAPAVAQYQFYTDVTHQHTGKGFYISRMNDAQTEPGA